MAAMGRAGQLNKARRIARNTLQVVAAAAQDPSPEPPSDAALSAGGSDASSTSTSGSATAAPPPPPPKADVPDIQLQLLRLLSSSDRGLAATRALSDEVNAVCMQLEAAGGAVVLGWGGAEGEAPGGGLAALNGTWRLVYSSGFVDGSLGGSRPGPPAVAAPFTLGQVYQTIASYIGKLDNVVELVVKSGLPSSFPGGLGDPAMVTATLKHTFEIVGNNTVKITFEDTEVKATGGPSNLLSNLPTLAIPQLPEPLRPPAKMRSASFDVTFLDQGMRITRGDKGELRIYLLP